MEFSQLRYFCAVAKSQHITQTAQALHIAQPALSQSIRRLEKELGVPLVKPKGRGIGLTPYGDFLYEKVSPLLDTLAQIPQDLEAMATTAHHTIHINVLAASAVVTASIIAYQQTYGHMNFQIFQNPDREICDIEVTTRLFYFPQDENCFAFTEQIYLAVPDKPPYSLCTSISLSQVSEEGFICLGGTSQFRTICDKFCAQAGFVPQVTFESDAPATVRNLIAAGLGVGFWPQLSWGTPDTSDILLLPITSPNCQRDLVISKKKNHQNNQHIDVYFQFLAQYFNSLSQEKNQEVSL